MMMMVLVMIIIFSSSLRTSCPQPSTVINFLFLLAVQQWFFSRYSFVILLFPLKIYSFSEIKIIPVFIVVCNIITCRPMYRCFLPLQ
jgi:hypothetical protein